MIRTLLAAAVAAAVLGACSQTGSPYDPGQFHHGGGVTGPSFSSRIAG